MKNLLSIVVILTIMIVFGKLSDHYPKNFAIFWYLIFVSIPAYKIFKNFQLRQLAARSTIYSGVIINYAKQDETDNADTNYNIEVQFNTPYSAKPYIIKSKIYKLPENGLVDIIFNNNNPEKSIVYAGFRPSENIYLLLLIAGFTCFFLFKVLHSQISSSSNDDFVDSIFSELNH